MGFGRERIGGRAIARFITSLQLAVLMPAD
jgi:hypothetical protein